MFFAVQANQYPDYQELLDQMFRLRKRVFADGLGWDVIVQGDQERDPYDRQGPVYLLWTDAAAKRLIGSLRLMPTTGPTLLNDVFRSTFPADIDLSAPDIWEGTRLCVDEEVLIAVAPGISLSRAFGFMLLALCECALEFGINSMISNYEPQLKRIYRAAGLAIDELGRADGFGRHPVCCGAFEVSEDVLARMRAALGVDQPLFAVSESELRGDEKRRAV